MYRAAGSMTSLILLLVLLSTTDSSGPAGGDETDLATSRRSPPDGGGLANVLMVTTTVGMLDRVHGHTTDLGPAVPLDLVLVVRAAGLQDGLVDTTAAGDDADGGAVGRGDDLLGAGGQLDPGPLGVGVVGDHDGVVAGGTGDTAAVAGLLLKVGDDGTLGHLSNGHDVSDGELRLLSAVDELSSVDTLGGDKELLAGLVPVRVTEVDDGEGSATAGVVDDVLHHTLNVSIPLGVVDRPELGSSLAVLHIGPEDGPCSLPLSTDDTTHFCLWDGVFFQTRTFVTRPVQK